MSHSLNTLKRGVYRGLYRVKGLISLKGVIFMGHYVGDHYRGYEGGY